MLRTRAQERATRIISPVDLYACKIWGSLSVGFRPLVKLNCMLSNLAHLLVNTCSVHTPKFIFYRTAHPFHLLHKSVTQSDEMKRSIKVEKQDPVTHSKRPMSSQDSDDDVKPTDHTFGFGDVKPIDDKDFRRFLQNIKEKKNEYCASIEDYDFDETRARCINGLSAPAQGDYKGVSYWMFRDQRIDDNWALIYAQKFALENKCPLYVTFYLMSHYSVAGTRQYDFMLRGLQKLEKQCETLGIQFHLELGYAKDHIVHYCENNKIDLVIADFMPLRDPLSWVEEAGRKLKKKNIPLLQVDAHNIIPCWKLVDYLAFGARSLRPKIHNQLPRYLTEIPALDKHPYQPDVKSDPVDWERAWAHLTIDETVKPLTWCKPGTMAGYKMLYEFITQRLKKFEEERNLPTKHALSCLSPWFHFGQLSVQRAILCVTEKPLKTKYAKSVESFVEEAVVRRELSDNFCFYQPEYDNFDGAWDWAKRSLNEHRKDKREYIYTQEEFQFGKTHDPVWNAAQLQMVREGKMHGYMRMYWAKKILEWTKGPEDALKIAIFLNDKYSMDGRDPNGYVGIMWSIVGIHDRGWTERPVFGKIRFMNYNGCARKFDINFYMKKYKP